MMKKKMLGLLCGVMFASLFAAGCGIKNESGAETTKKEETQGTETGTKAEAETLVVGLDDTFAPMGFRDTNGNLVGFDIDLATEVGKILNMTIEFKPIDWNTKEVALETGTVDCLWNGMSATPARQQEMTLTKNYLNNKLVVMALSPDVVVDSVEDLANYTIGTQDGSAALEVMQANDAYDSFSAKVSTYPTYDEVLLDMQAGRLDCMVVDQALGEYKNTQLDEKMTICNFNFGDDFYAIGCKKGNTELADKLNGALQELIDNGKAAEISEKWFGKNIVILE